MKSAKSPKKNSTKKTTTELKLPKTGAAKAIDPLYVIFEQHLFNFADPDSDRKTFIAQVVSDYIGYLRKNNIIVPKSLEQPIVEELGTQVNTMLVKKIYGCLTVNEFADPVASAVRSAKKRVKARAAKTG
ncbi:MAG: hypothetical protein JST04_17585 [Bdellovibrionales bacterium]|nr:hypothetical protein [Bdellovibrionales bacterium]